MDENSIIFLQNKYLNWYRAIISKASQRQLNGYVEKHHILPRSLGGDNSIVNIVSLTAREHFVCHLLLPKITTGYHQELMKFALGKFIQSAPGQERAFTSWEYKKIREAISQARTGKKHSEETRKKMSEKRKGKAPWNKGISGIVHSEESNKKRSETMRGKLISEEHKAKISKSKTGKPGGMTGKKHSEETLQRMRESALRRKHKA